MGKHSLSKRLSLPDIKSLDYKSRKHIEELYLITHQIINGHDDMKYKFDYKLYKKYKQLKEINKRLQQKIINQHCSGCKCHEQLSEEDTDESIPTVDSKSSTIKENKKTSSNTNKKSESLSEDEPDEEEQMDTNESVSNTTTDNHVIEEEEDDGFSTLPLLLQDIIKNKIEQSETNNKYLLKVGLYPELSKLLSDTSVVSSSIWSIKKEVRSFFSKHIKYNHKNYMKRLARFATEIRDIHQSYMLEFYTDQQKEESKANRKKHHQRKSL